MLPWMLSKRIQQLFAMAWMFIFPQISRGKTLMSKVTVLGNLWGQEDSTLVNGITFLIKKLLRASFIPAREIPWEDTLSAEEKDPSPNLDSIGVLIFDFWVSRTVSKKLPCSKFRYDSSQSDWGYWAGRERQTQPEPYTLPPRPTGCLLEQIVFFKEKSLENFIQIIDRSNIS